MWTRHCVCKKKINPEEREYILAISISMFGIFCFDMVLSNVFVMVLSHYEKSLVEWPLSPKYSWDLRQKDNMNKYLVFSFVYLQLFFTQVPFLNLQLSSGYFQLSVSHHVNFNRSQPILFPPHTGFFLKLLWSCLC